MFTTQQLKQILYLTLGFVITIQIGAFLSEKVKSIVAQQHGYTETCFTGFGDLVFENPEDQKKLEAISNSHDEDRATIISSPEWQRLANKAGHELGKIEIAGLLFNILISIIGLSIFYWRRYQDHTINYKDWISILMGLFFMKGVCYYTFFYVVLGGIPCINIFVWPSIGLDLYTMAKFYIALGWVALAVILYNLPSDFRWKFIISGLLGVPAGTLLWLYVVGDLMF